MRLWIWNTGVIVSVHVAFLRNREAVSNRTIIVDFNINVFIPDRIQVLLLFACQLSIHVVALALHLVVSGCRRDGAAGYVLVLGIPVRYDLLVAGL